MGLGPQLGLDSLELGSQLGANALNLGSQFGADTFDLGPQLSRLLILTVDEEEEHEHGNDDPRSGADHRDHEGESRDLHITSTVTGHSKPCKPFEDFQMISN